MKKVLVGALAALFLVGCGGGNTTDAQIEYNKQKGNAKDFPQKLEAATNYCDDGVKQACRDAVEILGKGPATLKDNNKAVKYAEKGCNAGDGDSCDAMAALYSTPIDKRPEAAKSIDIAYDPQKSIPYFEKACKAETKYCQNLAEIYMGENRKLNNAIGKETAQAFVDYDRAAAVVKKVFEDTKGSCNSDCNLVLAGLYLEKVKDAKKAKDFALKACDDSDGYNCYKLSKNFEELGDKEMAKTLATNGCNKNNRTACNLYEEKYKN